VYTFQKNTAFGNLSHSTLPSSNSTQKIKAYQSECQDYTCLQVITEIQTASTKNTLTQQPFNHLPYTRCAFPKKMLSMEA